MTEIGKSRNRSPWVYKRIINSCCIDWESVAVTIKQGNGATFEIN